MLQANVFSFNMEETDSKIECSLTVVASATPTCWEQCE